MHNVPVGMDSINHHLPFSLLLFFFRSGSRVLDVIYLWEVDPKLSSALLQFSFDMRTTGHAVYPIQLDKDFYRRPTDRPPFPPPYSLCT